MLPIRKSSEILQKVYRYTVFFFVRSYPDSLSTWLQHAAVVMIRSMVQRLQRRQLGAVVNTWHYNFDEVRSRARQEQLMRVRFQLDEMNKTKSNAAAQSEAKVDKLQGDMKELQSQLEKEKTVTRVLKDANGTTKQEALAQQAKFRQQLEKMRTALLEAEDGRDRASREASSLESKLKSLKVHEQGIAAVLQEATFISDLVV
jgi:DNA repair exonuclease SbcCD ATPase subunit